MLVAVTVQRSGDVVPPYYASISGPRPRRRRRVFLGAVAGVLLLGLVPAVRHGARSLVGADGPDGPRLTVATWNTCGVAAWGCGEYGGGEQKAKALRSLAQDHGARVVLVQEACRGDLDRARAGLGAAWQLAFEPYRQVDAAGAETPVDCGAGRGEAGFGILAAVPLTDVAPVESPQPAPGLHRGILCATAVPAAPAAPPLRVCVAHLSLPPADRSDRPAELRDDQLAALLAAAGAAGSVFGGDFNSSPPGPRNKDAWIWPAGYFDAVRECDQESAGQRSGFAATHENGLKLDYLFTALPRHGCSQVDTGFSDHRAELLTVAAAL
ncbi:endonuclease/exonuclease/phosphatase family protein [Kitasatospora sp. NPDC059646]|uniref:endonuclease/exonuclease/phosphatase family protein n=1 Tax=Kitasatospora sp. NPDC059646 TaxID=3346893 RepID=UPI0036A91DCE